MTNDVLKAVVEGIDWPSNTAEVKVFSPDGSGATKLMAMNADELEKADATIEGTPFLLRVVLHDDGEHFDLVPEPDPSFEPRYFEGFRLPPGEELTPEQEESLREALRAPLSSLPMLLPDGGDEPPFDDDDDDDED